MARILIGCEYSQTLTSAFAKLGHDVLSCDIIPSEGHHPHYTGNVLDLLHERFDLAVFFPPCTYLAKVSAVRRSQDFNRRLLQRDAFDFVQTLYHCPIPKVIIENPVGFLSTSWRAPDVITSPHLYGDAYRKEICLWHKNIDVFPRYLAAYSHLDKKRLPAGAFKSVSNHTNGRMSKFQKNKIRSSWSYFPNFTQSLALHCHSQLTHT